MSAAVVILALIMGALVQYMTAMRQNIRMRTGSYRNGQCQVEGRYAHDLDSFNSLDTERSYKLGSKWGERCRNCSCDASGAWCSGPRCALEYDFTQDKWCLQWSEDSCCCERLGCSVDGEQYDLDSVFPYGRGNPCLNCTCEIGTSLEHCLRQRCGTYHVACEGELTYDEKCCPHFICPVEEPCEDIPDPFPGTPQHELRDWYGGRLEPIPVGMTHHFHVDSWNTYVCRCPIVGNSELSTGIRTEHFLGS